MTRLEGQDKTLDQILREVKKTNGRVTKLETAGEVSRGKIAVISCIVSLAIGSLGWLATHFIK